MQTMYKTVIIDDEQGAVEVLKILLQKNFPDLSITASFTSSRQALDYLKQSPVDLVFLDIQMPVLSGLELLAEIPNPSFRVVFTTAFDQYAISAIKLSALDYLLKPIDEDLLRKTIDKFRKQREEHDLQSRLKQLLHHYDRGTKPALGSAVMASKIAVSFQDKILFYDPQDIVYCQSSDNYTTLHLKGGEKVIASKTIRYFEKILTRSGFIRPHQSYLINTNYIQQYSKKDGGFLVMQDGSSIPVSRNKKDEVLLMFKGEP